VDRLLDQIEETGRQLREAQRTRTELLTSVQERLRTTEELTARCTELDELLKQETRSREFLALELYKAEGNVGSYSFVSVNGWKYFFSLYVIPFNGWVMIVSSCCVLLNQLINQLIDLSLMVMVIFIPRTLYTLQRSITQIVVSTGNLINNLVSC